MSDVNLDLSDDNDQLIHLIIYFNAFKDADNISFTFFLILEINIYLELCIERIYIYIYILASYKKWSTHMMQSVDFLCILYHSNICLNIHAITKNIFFYGAIRMQNYFEEILLSFLIEGL